MKPVELPGASAVTQGGEGGCLALNSGAGSGPGIVVSRFTGPPLPGTLHDLRLEEAGPGRWRLLSAEGVFELQGAGIELIEPLPTLFEPLLSGFALKGGERWLVGLLLRLLRWPGGAGLLRRWQAARR